MLLDGFELVLQERLVRSVMRRSMDRRHSATTRLVSMAAVLSVACLLGFSGGALAAVVEIEVLPSGLTAPLTAAAADVEARQVVTTLHDAQRRARVAVAAGHDALVTLKAGTHHLLQPLRFGQEDSAGGQQQVVYRADPTAPLGTVAVSGGVPLPKGCFKPGPAAPGGTIYKCQLPVGFPATFFEQLFVNGKRCPRARFPNFDPADPTVDGSGYLPTPYSTYASYTRGHLHKNPTYKY